MDVQDVMHTTVTTVPPDALVRTAYQVMRDTRMRHLLVERRIGCLPVVDHATLVGVVTEMDCLRAFLETARDTEREETQCSPSIPKAP